MHKTPQHHRNAPVSPIEPYSAQRISLSLSDLVSPGLKAYDDLESETRTSVTSLNDSINYKKELKKLLSKSRGTPYEATLRRFVEAKYSEIKKDEASNRKLFGNPHGPGAVGPPLIASLSTSKYDAPSPMTLREANALYLAGNYHDGRIVENNYNTLSPQNSPMKYNTKSGNINGGNTKANGSINVNVSNNHHKGYSILNEMGDLTAKRVSLEVSYNNKTRIDEMAKPVSRNTYKGPPAVPHFSSTNHLGRQRPPPRPVASSSPGRTTSRSVVSSSPARRTSSPYTSPLQPRYGPGAFSTERGTTTASISGTTSSIYGDLEGSGSVITTPSLEAPVRERTYAEFRDWLQSNREWMRKTNYKLQHKEEEVLKQETHDFTPKIIPKSMKLANKANQRDFQRMSASSSPQRGRTRSPVSSYPDSSQVLYNSQQQAEHVVVDATERRDCTDSVLSVTSDRSTSPRSDATAATTGTATGTGGRERRRHSSLNSTVSESAASQTSVCPVQDHIGLRSRSIDERSEHSTATTTAAAAVQSHTQQLASNSASAAVPCQPPADVYERLAMRGKLKAMQTLHYDLPPSQQTFRPQISERSTRLAEKKHQRDALIRARSVSAGTSPSRPHTVPSPRNATTSGASLPGTDFLTRNYDYYELYTMPERYLERVSKPAQYKHNAPQRAATPDPVRRILEGSGLSKVAEKMASRGNSPEPQSGHRSSSNSGGAAASRDTPQRNGSAAMSVSELSMAAAGNTTADTEVPINRVLMSDRSVKADEGGKYHSAEGDPIHTDKGGKYFTHHDRPALHIDPSQYNAEAVVHTTVGTHLPGPAYQYHSTTGTITGNTTAATVSVFHVAKEAIRQRRDLSRSRREQALQELNRRNYLSKETKQSKPFQPLLMATETHRIMSKVRSTFDERSNKAVEDRVVRREVAGRFPSPGPGRYAGGIGVDKLVQVLSIGSPTKTTRSRSLSPAPGHRGFSFSRETLGRLDSPGAAYSPASPLNTMALNNTGKFSVK